MNAKELIRTLDDKGYIYLSNTDYGFIVCTDNQLLKQKVINTLENDDDYSMFQWTKYNVHVFSCEKFHDYCRTYLDGATKKFLPRKMYDESMPKYRDEAFKKFNEKYDDIHISGGYIVDVNQTAEQKLRQIEINAFIESLG